MLRTARLPPPTWPSTLGFDPARFQTREYKEAFACIAGRFCVC